MKTVDIYAALPKELVHSVTAPRRELPKESKFSSISASEIRAILSSTDPRPVQALLESSPMVHSTALYPNGDTISVYVVEASDGLYMTEGGTAFYNFMVGGLACTARLVDILNGICANIHVDLNGAKEGDGFYPASIGVGSKRGEMAADLLRLVEAVSKASTLGYFKEEFSRDGKRKDL